MAALKNCSTCLRYLAIEGRIEHLTDTYRFREASELAPAIPATYFDCDHCGRHVDARLTAGYLSCRCGRVFNQDGLASDDRPADPERYDRSECAARRAAARLMGNV